MSRPHTEQMRHTGVWIAVAECAHVGTSWMRAIAQTSPRATAFFWRYGGATAITSVALALRYSVSHYNFPAFVTFFPAVVFSTVLLGLRAGLFAVALSAILGGIFFCTPAAFSMSDPKLVLLVLFVIVGSSTSVFIDTCLKRRERAVASAARRLAAIEVELRTALAASGTGVWSWDAVKDEINWSPECEAILGGDRLNRSLAAFEAAVEAGDRARLRSAVLNAIETSSSYGVEFRMRAASGATRWLYSAGRCDQSSPGSIRVISTIQDITERKENEARVHNERARFEGILDTAMDAIIAFDEHKCIALFNRAAEHMFGLSHAEVIGRPLSLLMPEAVYEGVYVRLSALPHGVDRVVSATHQWVTTGLRRSGQTFPIEVSASKATTGATTIFTAIVRDITERKSAEHKNAFLGALVESSGDAIISFSPNATIATWNAGAERIFGYSAREAIGGPAGLLVPPGHSDGPNGYFDRVISGGEGFTSETLRQHKDGRLLDVFMSVAPIRDAEGGIIGVSAIVHDITTRKRDEARLQQAEIVFSSTHEGLVITDAESHIIAVNPAFAAITGYGEAELVGFNLRLLQSRREGRKAYEQMWNGLAKDGAWQGEVWSRRKNGEIYPQLVSVNAVRDGKGDVVNYVATLADLSRIRQSELKLEHLAHHDTLTDLPNRALLTRTLEVAIERAKRDDEIGAVLFIGVDRFKTINESLGHAAGDELLLSVARRLRSALGANDVIARVGGDEYAVVLEGLSDIADASRIAERVIERLEQRFVLAGDSEVYVSASIGISLFPMDGDTAARVIQTADTALYSAKKAGKGRYRYYDVALTVAASEQLDMDARLRRAIEAGEFVLDYQPLVSLADGAVTGVEALVRWRDPVRGIIPPGEFIMRAEETGLIIPLGEWVLRNACQQMQQWISGGARIETLAVNLSPRQFHLSNLVDSLRVILEDTQLDPSILELEITESTLIDHDGSAASKLAAIKSLGVRLAIDDFGTGYSSLSYLRRFPIDKLKVDRSFVRDLGQDKAAGDVAAAIIALGKTLNLKVLAEGVEHAEQRQFLIEHGCDLAQGYLFSPPIKAADVVRHFTWQLEPVAADLGGGARFRA